MNKKDLEYILVLIRSTLRMTAAQIDVFGEDLSNEEIKEKMKQLFNDDFAPKKDSLRRLHKMETFFAALLLPLKDEIEQHFIDHHHHIWGDMKMSKFKEIVENYKTIIGEIIKEQKKPQ